MCELSLNVVIAFVFTQTLCVNNGFKRSDNCIWMNGLLAELWLYL